MSEAKVVYDVNKPYKWQPDSKITLTGEQFATIFHMLNQEVGSPNGASIAHKYNCYMITLAIIKEGVESGLMVEDIMHGEDLSEVEGEVKQMFAK